MISEIKMTEYMVATLKHQYIPRKQKIDVDMKKYNLELSAFIESCKNELGIPRDWILDSNKMVFTNPPQEENIPLKKKQFVH